MSPLSRVKEKTKKAITVECLEPSLWGVSAPLLSN